MQRILWIIGAICLITMIVGACLAQTPIYDTGGPLMPEQAAYDVTYYDLALVVNPGDSSITGTLQAVAKIVQPVDYFVLDLDTVFAINRVAEKWGEGEQKARAYERRGGKIWINLRGVRQPGERVSVEIAYGGRPHIAPRPPWSGGFTWARTPSGAPWIATTCQGEGADIWWPVKDHVSDEPDSMFLHITVPETLVVASNGRLQRVERNNDGTSTYHWFISTPINTYNVALNIAPYRVIEDTMKSVAGDIFPVKFWVLPEDYEKGRKLFPEIKAHLRFFEKWLGPYPFRADKYGVVQTPHLGMEHQSIIAYGANFNYKSMTRGVDWGFDALHHHELSHEWWGNMVTNPDWRDMWLHEGFGTYMQALYLEQTQGDSAYHAYMQSMRMGVESPLAIAPRASRTGDQIYRAPIYNKGAWVLHTLRYLIGDKAFFTALRRMAYPRPELERITDGRQCRFASTEDFLRIAEEASGMDLDWFFEVYLRQPELPQLVSTVEGNWLNLRWVAPGGMAFPMPVDVAVNGKTKRVEMSDGTAKFKSKKGQKPQIDPKNWILRSGEYPEVVEVAPEILKSYVGTYKLSENFLIEISFVDGYLYAAAFRQPPAKIYPSSETEFFSRVGNLRLRFVKNEAGEVTALAIKRRRRERIAEKIQ